MEERFWLICVDKKFRSTNRYLLEWRIYFSNSLVTLCGLYFDWLAFEVREINIVHWYLNKPRAYGVIANRMILDFPGFAFLRSSNSSHESL